MKRANNSALLRQLHAISIAKPTANRAVMPPKRRLLYAHSTNRCHGMMVSDMSKGLSMSRMGKTKPKKTSKLHQVAINSPENWLSSAGCASRRFSYFIGCSHWHSTFIHNHLITFHQFTHLISHPYYIF